MLFHFSCNIDRLPTTRFLKIHFSKLWSKDVFQCFGKESSKYQVQQSFKKILVVSLGGSKNANVGCGC